MTKHISLWCPPENLRPLLTQCVGMAYADAVRRMHRQWLIDHERQLALQVEQVEYERWLAYEAVRPLE